MLKKSPSRSSRSKGIKVKHVLQIVLLVGVCFWLIYQVKRSHDKKKEFDRKDNEVSIKTQDGVDVLKLGRKDLHPHVEEVHPGEKQEEDEEDEVGGEEEDLKHEGEEGHEELKNEAVDEKDEGSKHEEETDDDGRGGGDDDIDENDQEKADNESDREGENVDDERLNEDSDEDAGGNEERDKEEQRENENSSDEQENDGGDQHTHEAREENYKGDDASSAVAHDDHSTTSQTEEVNLENSNENSELNGKEQDGESGDTVEFKQIHNSSQLTEEVDKVADTRTSTNENSSDVKLNENTHLPTDGSVQNSILTTQSNDQPELSNNSSSATTETNKVENTDSSQQNGTEIGLNHARDETIENSSAQNETSLQSLILTNLNDTVLENNNSESQSNTTSIDENPNGVEGKSLNITSEADPTVTDNKTTKPEKDDKTTEPENVLPTMKTQENSETTPNEKLEDTGENSETTQNEKLEDTGKNSETNQNEKVEDTGEKSETSQNEKLKDNGESSGESSNSANHTEDPVHEDPIDSDDSHVTERVDLDTLPDIRSEVDHSEESAAE